MNFYFLIWLFIGRKTPTPKISECKEVKWQPSCP